MASSESRGPPTPRDPAQEQVVEACELNYIDYWKSATAASANEWSDEGGIERCITGLHQEIFNVVLRCQLSPENASHRIDRVIGECRARRIPMIWHVGRTTAPEGLGSLLEERGFPHDYDLVAMAVDLSKTTGSKPAPDGVSVRTCVSRGDREDWIDCLTRSWDSPDEVKRWMLTNPFFIEEGHPSYKRFSSRVMYLGSFDGTPCAAMMMLASRGSAGLQCVGTIAEFRRKGVGEALVRAAMRDASASGHGHLLVLSTTEGVPLYRKAGFREYGKLQEHSLYFDRMPP